MDTNRKAKYLIKILLIIGVICIFLLIRSCFNLKQLIITPTTHEHIEFLDATTSKKLTNNYTVCFALIDHDPLYGNYIQLCISGPPKDRLWNQLNSTFYVDDKEVLYTALKHSTLFRTYHLFLLDYSGNFQEVSYSMDDIEVCFIHPTDD